MDNYCFFSILMIFYTFYFTEMEIFIRKKVHLINTENLQKKIFLYHSRNNNVGK